MSLVALIIGLLLLCLGGVLAFADHRWRATSAGLVTRLEHRRVASPPAAFSEAELEGLPAPVMRYFRAVLRDGQPLVRRARLSQRGEFLVRPTHAGWHPFRAIQHVATAPAGFVWDARIRLAPRLNIRVRNAFIDGTGSMRASVLGLFPLVSVEATPEIAAGALHRYLAEAVWFPTALLPTHGVVWTPLDDSSARVTLSVAATTVSLDFHFGDDSLVHGVFTSARAREVEGHAVLTPWQGRFSEYAERDSVRIPLTGEVEWLLPDGPQLYWRGRITEIAYEYVQPR